MSNFTHDFLDDAEKMRDFWELSKDEFLQSYSYLTKDEYDATFNKVREVMRRLSETVDGPYLVITTYSFCPAKECRKFYSRKEATDFIREDWEREIQLDKDSKLYADTFSDISADNDYATIINYNSAGDRDVTEWDLFDLSKL